MPVATHTHTDKSQHAMHSASTARANFVLTVTGRDSPHLLAATLDCLRFNGFELEQLDRHYSADDAQPDVVFRVSVSGTADAQGRFDTDFASEIAGPFGVRHRFRRTDQLTRVGILVSKETYCLQSLIEASKDGQLPIKIETVLSNHLDAEWAVTSSGLPFHHLPTTSTNRVAVERRQLELLANRVDLVILARYMRVLSADFLHHVGVPVINIHHSLLPAFMGASPHRRAKERGVKLIGATAHYATADLDAGPIIEQDCARVAHRHSLDDLRRISSSVESATLLTAVKAHCEDRVFVRADSTCVVF